VARSPATLGYFLQTLTRGTEKSMREPERSDRQIVSTTGARQGVTGHNVNVVLIVSLLLAATLVSFWLALPGTPVGRPLAHAATLG
jgi:hypothetical protein